MSEAEIRERIRNALSPYRFQHVEGVVQTAERLSIQYGVDAKQARLAAWLHDFAREWPPEKLQAYSKPLQLPEEYRSMPELLHGPIVAHYLEEWFQIRDEEIANAIYYHTTGRPQMSIFEKVICLADAIEPGRVYPGVEECRILAQESLEHALAVQFDGTIRFLLDRKKEILPLTVAARNEFWRQVGVMQENRR
ncbi:bis(5'-nucleosyl)-tetraphosphatase (symmetrical) YqeK [Fodinisporobacter ferrooxydans]|uniref:bis(5'-nucleosyl)-tetraphosphatase (symmetrical) n=1 Tax=Fodinisporobacter ferrooxydans TaxID=2901836 RepID=A0ABY4CES2_9BACL|nr:bis(5'-nucleosyl)-tetraphosphatase (symmetrical) YqeK [Alicyclobacillaceae bacterium MYW30-H2]